MKDWCRLNAQGGPACLAQTRRNRPGKKGMDRPNGDLQTLKFFAQHPERCEGPRPLGSRKITGGFLRRLVYPGRRC